MLFLKKILLAKAFQKLIFSIMIQVLRELAAKSETNIDDSLVDVVESELNKVIGE